MAGKVGVVLMLAQRLRHQITIQSRTTSSGWEDTSSWGTLRTVFAGVEPLSGKEFQASGAVAAETTVRFVCRHEDVSDVTSQMRISFDGKLYDIMEVINERTVNRMVSLMAKVGTNTGGQ